MELYLLESFVAVAKSGSLSKAATVRNLSLPGLSKHIKMLEEHFGFELFQRKPRGMEISKRGEEVLRYAIEILDKVENMTALSTNSSQIRIGVNLSPDFLQLSTLTRKLQRNHSDKQLCLTKNNSGILLQQLEKEELDICLAFGDIPDRFVQQIVCRVRLVLMTPLSMTSEVIDLRRICWVISTRDCPFQKALEKFWKQNNITPYSTIISQDSSRNELISQGMGIGFLEPQEAAALEEQNLAKQIEGYFLDVPLSIVYRSESFRPVVEHLCRYIRTIYGNLL